MRNRMKRIIAIVLALLLVLGMMPGAALADPPAGACSGKDAADRNNGQHFWDAVGKQAASCTEEEGIIWKCVYCGQQYFEKTGDALGHDWTAWWTEKEATCEEAGSKRRVCNRCEREETAPIPALGHAWGEWQTRTPATCEAAGTKTRVCGNCRAEQTDTIPALGHSWDSGVVTKPASYTEEGVKTYTCQNDRSHTRTERIPKLDPTPTPKPTPTQAPTAPPHEHTWGEWKTDKSVHASCIQREMQYRTCSGCGETEYRYVGYGDHDWGEWEVVTPATATEPGLERRTCRNDPSHTEERDIPATGDIPGNVPWTEGAALSLDIHLDPRYAKESYDNMEQISLEFTATNTGSVTLNGVNYYHAESKMLMGMYTLPLAPGESTSFWLVANAYDNDNGKFTLGGMAVGFAEGQGEIDQYSDATAAGKTVTSNTDYVSVALNTAPKASLHLEMRLTPEHAQEAYETDEMVFVDRVTTNTGAVPVHYIQYYAYGSNLCGMYTETVAPGETIVSTIGFPANDTGDGTCTITDTAVGVTQPEDAAYSAQMAGAAAAGSAVISNAATLVIPMKGKENPKAELLLVDNGDSPAQDIYDADGHVFTYYRVYNTGERTLDTYLHIRCSNGYTAIYNWGILEPGGSSGGGAGAGTGYLPERITPGTETEELLGTADQTFWYVGYDPETGEELCTSNEITRSWKVRKPGPGEWEIPEESRLAVTQRELSTPANPNGYQLGETWTLETEISNVGAAAVDFTISLDDIRNLRNHVNDFPLEPGMQTQYWSNGTVTEEDVERGYIYFVPAEITWTDPDSEKEHTIWSNDVVLPVMRVNGPWLQVVKTVESRPANGQYFTTGETIDWGLVITNTGTDTMKDLIKFSPIL